MEEYTNSEPVVTDETDGGDMFIAETPEPNEPAGPETPETPEPTKPAEPATSKLKIKYNGAEQEITLEEAAILAQKGMNYDKAIERERAAAAKVTNVIEHYAQANGMTTDEYIQYLDQQRDIMVLQRELEQVKQQYPDIGEAAANEMAKIRAEKSREKISQAAAEKKKADEEAALKPWKAFAEKYPDMKDISKIPQVVFEKVQAGYTPVEAMMEYERDELKAKIAALEKNTKNKEKSVGSVTSTASAIEPDAFLSGLNG